jgi:hypothetical protein
MIKPLSPISKKALLALCKLCASDAEYWKWHFLSCDQFPAHMSYMCACSVRCKKSLCTLTVVCLGFHKRKHQRFLVLLTQVKGSEENGTAQPLKGSASWHSGLKSIIFCAGFSNHAYNIGDLFFGYCVQLREIDIFHKVTKTCFDSEIC